jgi:hypothetical protein
MQNCFRDDAILSHSDGRACMLRVWLLIAHFKVEQARVLHLDRRRRFSKLWVAGILYGIAPSRVWLKKAFAFKCNWLTGPFSRHNAVRKLKGRKCFSAKLLYTVFLLKGEKMWLKIIDSQIKILWKEFVVYEAQQMKLKINATNFLVEDICTLSIVSVCMYGYMALFLSHVSHLRLHTRQLVS